MTDTNPDPSVLEARFQALSDGNRLRILWRLTDGERCVCELAEALDLGQSLLSFHLKTLREAGLVRARKEGRWMHYRLEPGSLEPLLRFLLALEERGPAAGSPEPRDRTPAATAVDGG